MLRMFHSSFFSYRDGLYMEHGRPLLSISLLASNRIGTIRRCLDSLLPIMEHLPCELIVVDTSTQPEVRELLWEYTDRVIPFLWCNDFSKARNCGLSEARGEWFLYIDDDEWFENADEIIRFFNSGEYHDYGYANYVQRNFFDPEYLTYTDNWVSRMVRLNDEVRFRSKIHEYLDPVYGKGKNIKAIANHTGYIYATEEERRKRYERNVPLLKEMMAEKPDQLRWAIQLVQEYYSAEEWKELERFCRVALQNENYRKQPVMKRLAATFYAGLVESVLEQNRADEALDEVRKAVSSENCSRLGVAYLLLQEAIGSAEKKAWDEAKACIEKYFALEKEITEDEEQYAIWQEALIVDSTYDMINKKKAYLVLLLCNLAQDNEAEVIRLFLKLEWNQSVVYAYPHLMPILLELLVEHAKGTSAETIWRSIWDHKQLCDMMIEESRKYWERIAITKRTFLRENYHEQVMILLSRYYKPEILNGYTLCLPDIAQRALGLIDEIERGKE